MTGVTIIENEPEPEVPAISTDAAEAVAEAVVEVAEIEADRDITLAKIAAETQVEMTAALGRDEVVSLQAELETCWNQISTLETINSDLMATVERLTPPPSTPPPSSEMNPLPEPESVVETPVSPEEAPPVVEEPPKPKRRGVRWI